MEAENRHECKNNEEPEENEIAIWKKGYYPDSWCLFTTYNVQIKVNFCPFCGVELL